MRIPSDSELTFLFEGDEQRLQQFIEKYRETFEHYQLMDDVKELSDEFTIKEQIPIVFAFVYGVTVDWREYDEEIIQLFSERLPDETVEVATTDKGLEVTYNGQLHSIALTFSGKDRYITIRGFQELIRDKYEIRLFEASYFSDTHDFLVLPKQQWEELDAQYPAQIGEMFRVIDDGLDFP
ncbi:hypothetical protein [Aneurinibacillus aneurinilyticus]|uniref:Uncharacterized protein n=1 Tax=Aneurinibacillus aneurinilyticus TaxID=1391 RepID=A0A848D2Q4_ANEAE|nr:hypothetical protein [Aneurinibacillus aneurinilyticus]NMF01050.1 hypothetical protein [Aneurinibacillus aneurinilyticus]